MKSFSLTVPVLDARELALIEKLTEEYKKLTSPGKLSKAASAARNLVVEITPERLRQLVEDAVEIAADLEIVKEVLKQASRGFSELSSRASRFTLSHDSVVEAPRAAGAQVDLFEEICALRSYRIEPVARSRDYRDLLAAFVEGAITGAPGLPGVPFNIALSFFLYFRAVQSTALFYGYDIRRDPRELEFASAVTIACFGPQVEGGVESLSGLIAKMMFAANLTALRHALATKTYTEMAKKSGSQLLYVQVRALANRAAANALRRAGKGGLEAKIFRDLLEQIGRRLPKEAGKKGVPLLGAAVGGLSDYYYMSRVLRISNLIYHKRFLFEKEHRVALLCGKLYLEPIPKPS